MNLRKYEGGYQTNNNRVPGPRFCAERSRVRWHTKILVLIPLGYIISPIDLIPGSLLFIGQRDDLIVIRTSYVVLGK
jgi:uncharacterized membrane protein YkvA (DUF1232 family)